MKLEDIRVFVCVPGVGKTTLEEMDDRFVDLDRLKSEYKYGVNSQNKIEFEANKGNRGQLIHEDANEYIEKLFLNYLEHTDKILLFAPNPAMVEMIVKYNVPYCLVYHSKDKETVEEIRQRMRDRGNKENFIDSMTAPDIMEDFYMKSVTDTRPTFKIELFKGEYLSDKLLPLLDKNTDWRKR